MVKFAILRRSSRLLMFTPHDVTEMAEGSISLYRGSDSLTSPLLVSLMTAVVKKYTDNAEPEIGGVVQRQLEVLTNTLFPPLPPVSGIMFPVELLADDRYILFVDYIDYPELLQEGFSFLSQTLHRYSFVWSADVIQRWMVSILQAIGRPDGLGPTFIGAIDFLVCHRIPSADVRRISWTKNTVVSSEFSLQLSISTVKRSFDRLYM